MSYTVIPIDGITTSDRRCVVFLRDAAGELDASEVFASLRPRETAERQLRDRFDFWISFGAKKEWFHGWDIPEFRACFVFKWNRKNVGQRFYGFLCHPQPNTRSWFQLCVLHTHDQKTDATDQAHLRLANRLRNDPQVKAAIQMHFPDIKPGEKKWNH